MCGSTRRLTGAYGLGGQSRQIARFLTSCIVTLTLILSTVGVGMARGQMPAADTFVICSGHVVTYLSVDASGTPVERQLLCPDAGFLFADFSLGPSLPPVRDARALDLGYVSASLWMGSAEGRGAPARAPPVV